MEDPDDPEFQSWTNPIHLNNGCNPVPCDPGDLFKLNARIGLENGNPMLYTIAKSWAGDGVNYWIRSNLNLNGYFIFNR